MCTGGKDEQSHPGNVLQCSKTLWALYTGVALTDASATPRRGELSHQVVGCTMGPVFNPAERPEPDAK